MKDDFKGRPQILVSACLLGQEVRHDGGHCRHKTITNVLSDFIEFVPVCPEVHIGFGIPRKKLHLERRNDKKVLIDEDGVDHSDKMSSLSTVVDKDGMGNICGAILKKKSPSCGLERIKLHDQNRKFLGDTAGIYVDYLRENYNIPLIDEGRVSSKELLRHFLTQVFALHLAKQVIDGPNGLREFHTEYKFMLYEFNQNALRELGRIAAEAKEDTYIDSKTKYLSLFVETLKKGVSDKNRLNCLFHIFGLFKSYLKVEEKDYMLKQFNLFSQSVLPYHTILKQLELLVVKYEVDYLRKQRLFRPFPEELMILF